MPKPNEPDESQHQSSISNDSNWFSQEVSKNFAKAIPLNSERSRRSRNPSSVCGNAPPSTIKKKLNFDESFTFEPPGIPRLKYELAESKELLDACERKLQNKDRLIADLRKENEVLMATVSDLRTELSQLRISSSNSERNEQMRSNMGESEAIIQRIRASNFKEGMAKFVQWFELAKQQLLIARQIFLENGLWNLRNRNKLIKMHLAEEPTQFSEEELYNLISGSVLDFPNIFDQDDENFLVEITDNGNSQTSENIPKSCMKCRESNSLNSSLLSSRPLNSSIDFERDEKIERLQHKNSILMERIQIASGRAQRAMLLEEKATGLEQEHNALQSKLDDALKRNEALRSAAANGIFPMADANAHQQALEFVDKISELKIENGRLHTKLNELLSSINELSKLKNTLQDELNMTSGALGKVRKECDELTRMNTEISSQRDKLALEYKNVEVTLLQTKQAFEAAQAETKRIADELKATAKTDAGNTTQILHLLDNPLQSAHDQMIHNEHELKRKSDQIPSPQSKRTKFFSVEENAAEQELAELKFALMKTERERDSSRALHDEFSSKMKKFKEIVTVLIGYQIKVRDFELGLCSLSSIYDEQSTEFLFQYHADSGQLDLLDSGQDISTIWGNQARHYLGDRQTVPAFLAAVTLELEKLRQHQLDDRTHAVSIIYE